MTNSIRPTFSNKAQTSSSWTPFPGKIALEEHVFTDVFNAASTTPATPSVVEFSYFAPEYTQDMIRRLGDVKTRLDQMDASGIQLMTVGLASPGIEGIFDTQVAIETARKANDQLHSIYGTGSCHSDRFRVWGCVPMQDPVAAAAEAHRCICELGFAGFMINGHTNLKGGLEDVQYLDEPQCEPFWEAIEELGVPIYLHPRNLPPSQMKIFRGYEYLGGSALAFARETQEHAIRLMVSGLFDRHPSVQIVLGHAGEGLSFSVPRLDHRVRHFRPGCLTYKHPLTYYLTHNFYVTCSGVMRESTLRNTLDEFGPSRVLFSTDYPFECMLESSRWFDGLELNEDLRAKLGYENARTLLKLQNV